MEDLSHLQWRHRPTYRTERLAIRDPLALAIDLFLLQGILPADELDRLFSRSDRDVFIRTGIIAIDETGQVRLVPRYFPSAIAWSFRTTPGPSFRIRATPRFRPIT